MANGNKKSSRFSARNMILLAIVGAAIGIFFGWLALQGQDWGEIARSFRQASIPLMLAGLVAVFATGFIRAFRWWLLFVREKITVTRLYFVEHAGIGANSVSPVRLLAEPVQFGLLKVNDGLRSGDIVASLSLQRATDLVVTVIIIGILVATVPPMAPMIEHAGLATAAAVVGLLLMLSPFLLIPLSTRVERLRNTGLVKTFHETMRIMGGQKLRLAAALGVTAVYWAAIGTIGWIAASAVGIDLPIHVMLAISLAIIFFSTSVPGVPGAFGTFEAAAVYLLALWEIPREQALLFGLVFHVITFLPPILIAMFVLPREGIRSFDGIKSLVSSFQEEQEEEEEEAEQEEEEAREPTETARQRSAATERE